MREVSYIYIAQDRYECSCLQRAQEDAAKNLEEQEALKTHQNTTIKKVLESQIELSAE